MVRVIWLLDLQLPMQSVHITTNVVIQHVMIKFVCDLLQVSSFFWYSGFLHQTDCHDITEILLKVALNTIIVSLKFVVYLLQSEEEFYHVITRDSGHY